MKVVKLDDYNYVVSMNGEDLYRVYHSEVAHAPFITVQVLDLATPKYCYYTWHLADDGTLHARIVNDKIVPDDTKDSSTVRKLIKANIQNPSLFGDEIQFTKDK